MPETAVSLKRMGFLDFLIPYICLAHPPRLFSQQQNKARLVSAYELWPLSTTIHMPPRDAVARRHKGLRMRHAN